MGPGDGFFGEATSLKALVNLSPAPRRDECGESGRKQARPALHRGRDRRHRPAVAHEAERVATTVLSHEKTCSGPSATGRAKGRNRRAYGYYCGCTGAVAGGGVAVGALGVEPGSKYQTMISARTTAAAMMSNLFVSTIVLPHPLGGLGQAKPSGGEAHHDGDARRGAQSHFGPLPCWRWVAVVTCRRNLGTIFGTA